MRLLVVFLSLISVCAYANSPSTMTESFLSMVAINPAKATDELMRGSALEAQPQAIAAMKVQLASAISIYGNPLGFEKVSEQEISPSLRRLVYIQKYESLPMGWEFYFYRARDRWFVIQFIYKDQAAQIVGGTK